VRTAPRSRESTRCATARECDDGQTTVGGTAERPQGGEGGANEAHDIQAAEEDAQRARQGRREGCQTEEGETMNAAMAMLGGAGLMYLLDPDRGRRRRALVRDQVVHLANKTEDAAEATMRDMTNRMRGTVARTRRMLTPEHDVPDEVLVQRVRSQLGPFAHRAIEVSAARGRVQLSGRVARPEAEPLLRVIRRIRGVADVDNQLEVDDSAESSVQATDPSSPVLPNLRSPTARALMGVGAAALVALAAARSRIARMVLGAAGAALLVRTAATDQQAS
jgi:osmotically-inducible protein OsmY